MTSNISYEQAMIFVEQAFRAQSQGQLGEAIQLYQRSLEVHPTAEAHTYLGWAYSLLGRYDEAIEQCELAIVVDPEFGNPYNDIGAYLIELGKWEEAVPWFEDALEAQRYEAPHFPHVNLARTYEQLGKFKSALEEYDKALAIAPLYRPARDAKYALLGRLN